MNCAFFYRFLEKKPNLVLLDSKPKIQRVIHELSELASTDNGHVKAFFNVKVLQIMVKSCLESHRNI
jgi:hypothetical protein